MTEYRLIGAMEEEISARIAAVEQQAAATIRTLEAETDATLADEQRRALAREDDLLREYRRRNRSRFDNQWRDRLRNLQFEIAEQVFRDLDQAIARIRERADYGDHWQGWLDEALAVYRAQRDDRPRLQVACADRPLAQRRAAEFDAVETSPTVADGVELRSPDGRLHIVNTLASRLARGREEFLKTVIDTLKSSLQFPGEVDALHARPVVAGGEEQTSS